MWPCMVSQYDLVMCLSNVTVLCTWSNVTSAPLSTRRCSAVPLLVTFLPPASARACPLHLIRVRSGSTITAQKRSALNGLLAPAKVLRLHWASSVGPPSSAVAGPARVGYRPPSGPPVGHGPPPSLGLLASAPALRLRRASRLSLRLSSGSAAALRLRWASSRPWTSAPDGPLNVGLGPRLR